MKISVSSYCKPAISLFLIHLGFQSSLEEELVRETAESENLFRQRTHAESVEAESKTKFNSAVKYKKT